MSPSTENIDFQHVNDAWHGRGDFFQVPRSVLNAALCLSPADFRLWVALVSMRHQGHPLFPGSLGLAILTRSEDRNVRRQKKRLEALGFIKLHPRGSNRSPYVVLLSPNQSVVERLIRKEEQEKEAARKSKRLKS